MIVKVITRHTPSNYGSLLQSIATLQVLMRLEQDASIIDYIRPDDLGLKKIWTEACIKYGSFIKKFAYAIIRYPVENIAEIRFRGMRKKYLKTTDRCSSLNELKKIEADVFMTGSDQVWGPMVNGAIDPAYFLTFVSEKKRISYAASFGKIRFDGRTELAYKSMLSTYDKIAVRESSALDLLKRWNLQNIAGQVVDPTLLMTSDEWCSFFNIMPGKSSKKYILVYQIHNNAKLSAYAKGLAVYKKMQLIRVNPFLHQFLRGGKFVLCPDVKKFIQLIDNAACIVTDSFHGTCFAINFNKQFVEILPNNATGTRNQSVLAMTGLLSRIVSDFSDYSIADEPIVYEKVNAILKQERTRSLELLKRMIDIDSTKGPKYESSPRQ